MRLVFHSAVFDMNKLWAAQGSAQWLSEFRMTISVSACLNCEDLYKQIICKYLLLSTYWFGISGFVLYFGDKLSQFVNFEYQYVFAFL